MVELGDVGDRLESLLEVGNLLELATKLDNRGASEFSGPVHGQNTVLKIVELGLDEKKITVSQLAPNSMPNDEHLRARLYRQKS